MTDDMEQAPEPRDGALTVLKWLVIALTATMLVGMMALVWLFFTRFPAPGPSLPDQIALPEGARATAFTRGSGWLAVVTGDNEILIFSPDGETLRQRIRIDQP